MKRKWEGENNGIDSMASSGRGAEALPLPLLREYFCCPFPSLCLDVVAQLVVKLFFIIFLMDLISFQGRLQIWTQWSR